MTEEPSVLDYVKAKLTPWRGPAPRISFEDQPSQPTWVRQPEASPATSPTVLGQAISWPWISAAAVLLVIAAQFALEPRLNRSWELGAALYVAAFTCLIWANLRGEWILAAPREGEQCEDPLTVNAPLLWIGIGLALVAFWAMGNNRFTAFNLAFLLASLFFVARAFWLPDGRSFRWLARPAALLSRPRVQLILTPWTWMLLAAAVLVVFFRVYLIEQVPAQMVSDHAEKLLDVWDVVHGETKIFFPRNTGRESLQMYLSAAAVQFLGTGYSFLSLKLGTILAGLLTLPFIYLLGKEVGNHRVGLLALLFAGIAYWPNVVARSGLRFPLYPLFVAPTLYFLIRGIRRSSRNDFILAGLSLGIGLHGYTPIRILPVVVVVAVLLYLLHRQSIGVRRQTIWALVVLAFIALIVFIPLLRYSYSDPDMFGYRAFSRLGTIERPLPGPAGEIFLKNLWKAVTMFAWDDGEIWVVSVTHRPALDVVSAAFFHGGVVLLLARYLRRRHWLDLFLLLAVPLLMLPSILSLAYPTENPALNRASGALVPTFLIVAIAIEGLLVTIKSYLGSPLGTRVAWGLGMILIALSAGQNYDLVFNQYRQAYERSSWNTTELGKVIHHFAGSVGSLDSAWVVAFPHWVDTRLVGMNAGNPTRDYAITPERLVETLSVPEPKLFLVNNQDTTGLQVLQDIYPRGWLQRYYSQYEGRDFFLYFVPPQH